MRNNAVLVFLAISLALIFSEVVLRTLTSLPVTTESNQRPHPTLGYVLDPDLSDVDDRGFRDRPAAGPGALDLVAIGDSHTYGINVAASASWPELLSETLGRDVYNTGIGGYSVYQYARVFDLAVELGARDIVLALYPANDLGGAAACDLLTAPTWADYIHRLGLTIQHCLDLEEAAPAPPLPWWRTAYRAAGRKTAVVNLINLARSARRAREGFLIGDPDGYSIHLPARSVDIHARATSLTDELARGHFDNATRILSYMASRSSQEGVGFRVFVVPSKERVAATWAESRSGRVPTAVQEAVELEVELTTRFEALLRAEGVPIQDATDQVVASLARSAQEGRAYYPPNDGHPFEDGYTAYAAAAASLFNR